MKPSILLCILCGLFAPTSLSRLSAQPDQFWLRQSGFAEAEELAPFRTLMGLNLDLDKDYNSQLRSLLQDLELMQRIAQSSTEGEVFFDERGLEVCSDPEWRKAYERIQSSSLRMGGHLGMILRKCATVDQRKTALYGMFYLNDVQAVFDLIAHVPGEPLARLRQQTYQRAIPYLQVHLPKSKPFNPAKPKGIISTRYAFNAWPFMQLWQQEEATQRAQGLWFLGEVLRIRPDLGREFLKHSRDTLPGLLADKDKEVQELAKIYLGRIDSRRPDAAKDRKLEEVLYDLLPPIRHISNGVTELHPSTDLEQIVAQGQKALQEGSICKRRAGVLGNGRNYLGVEILALPGPLQKLGIPLGAVITHLNGTPVTNAAGLLQVLRQKLAQQQAVPLPLPPAPPADKRQSKAKVAEQTVLCALLVDFVHKDRAFVKEFRLIK